MKRHYRSSWTQRYAGHRTVPQYARSRAEMQKVSFDILSAATLAQKAWGFLETGERRRAYTALD